MSRARVLVVVSSRDLLLMQQLTRDHGAVCRCDTCDALRGEVLVRNARKRVRS